MNDWLNNSPVVTEPAPTKARSVTLPPEQDVLPATTLISVGNPVTGIANVHTTTAPVASTSNNLPAMQLQNKTVPQPIMAAAHLPLNLPVTSTPTTNVTAPPIVPTVMVQSQSLTVPSSHVLPNLSAWTFPTGPSNPPASATLVSINHTVFQTVLPATSVAPKASLVIPVTAGRTVYYIYATSLANVPTPGSAPVPTTFPAVPSTATPFATPPFVNVPQTATTSFTVQDLAQLLASLKRDHLPEWKLAQ